MSTTKWRVKDGSSDRFYKGDIYRVVQWFSWARLDFIKKIDNANGVVIDAEGVQLIKLGDWLVWSERPGSVLVVPGGIFPHVFERVLVDKLPPPPQGFVYELFRDDGTARNKGQCTVCGTPTPYGIAESPHTDSLADHVVLLLVGKEGKTGLGKDGVLYKGQPLMDGAGLRIVAGGLVERADPWWPYEGLEFTPEQIARGIL